MNLAETAASVCYEYWIQMRVTVCGRQVMHVRRTYICHFQVWALHSPTFRLMTKISPKKSYIMFSIHLADGPASKGYM